MISIKRAKPYKGRQFTYFTFKDTMFIRFSE